MLYLYTLESILFSLNASIKSFFLTSKYSGALQFLLILVVMASCILPFWWIFHFIYKIYWSVYLFYAMCACDIFILFIFIFSAFNLRSLKDRVENKLNETLSEELEKILSDLVQVNASVAALHTDPPPKGFVSENLLRNFDDVFRSKEMVGSIEKVISARQNYVSARVGHIKEDQQRVRRAVTAAGGGVFTGFFVFEVGDAAMKYVHLIHGQDDRSMFFWLTTEAGPYSNPALVSSGKFKSGEIAENQARCDASHKDPGVCKYMELTPGTPELRTHFMEQYQESELHAYGWLLAITLLVSVVAAWIGWRKPAEEHAGSHEGHH